MKRILITKEYMNGFVSYYFNASMRGRMEVRGAGAEAAEDE